MLVQSYATYFGKTLLPANLAVFYPHPQCSLNWSDVVAAAIILAVITVGVLFLHRARYLVMGWCLFVITLIPVIGIVQVGRQAMADRYAYVPCVGLFIIIAWGLNDVVGAIQISRLVPAVAGLCAFVALGIATARYLQYWQDGVKLLSHAEIVAGRPDPGLEEFLGDELAYAGRLSEAYQHYGEACILLPNNPTCHYNMAEILLTRHQLQDALSQYQLAGTLASSREMVLSSLVNSSEILIELGDYQAAEVRLTAALRLDPTNNAALRLQQRALKPQNSRHE